MSEENTLELMDVISVDSFFYTESKIKGFVTSIKPGLYNAVVEIGIYIPDPPGNFGPLCDPFNNALEIPSRGGNIEVLWGAEERVNDAGEFKETGRFVGGKFIADINQKDAGEFPRIITCFD